MQTFDLKLNHLKVVGAFKGKLALWFDFLRFHSFYGLICVRSFFGPLFLPGKRNAATPAIKEASAEILNGTVFKTSKSRPEMPTLNLTDKSCDKYAT